MDDPANNGENNAENGGYGNNVEEGDESQGERISKECDEHPLRERLSGIGHADSEIGLVEEIMALQDNTLGENRYVQVFNEGVELDDPFQHGPDAPLENRVNSSVRIYSSVARRVDCAHQDSIGALEDCFSQPDDFEELVHCEGGHACRDRLFRGV